MKIYLINLDRREDRLQLMYDTFCDLGLSFIRVPAIDGMNFSKNFTCWPYPITPGEIGCFLSHKQCIEFIAEGNDDYGIVLEDDVKFKSGVSDYLTSTRWIPKNADVVKLDTNGSLVLIKDVTDIDDSDLHIGRLMSSHVGAAAYIISKKAAIKLLPLLNDMKIPIDCFLFTNDRKILNSMFVYQTIPALAHQIGSPSTINLDRELWEGRLGDIAKPTLIRKIKREVLRPLKKAYAYIAELILSIKNYTRNRTNWIKVPFD